MNAIATHLLVLSMITVSYSCSIAADEDQERAVLARFMVEINALSLVIDDAEKFATTKARRQFDYAALRRDLHLIQRGVQDHLNRVRREPRQLPAIEGDYR